MMNKYDEYDDFDSAEGGSEELSVANILIYGTPAAKQEIIVKLIYIGNVQALDSVLLAMSDQEYNRVMPLA